MSDLTHVDTSTFVDDERIKIFKCSCGKEFNIRGYPEGYKFACPRCQALCIIGDQERELKGGTVLSDFVIEKRIGRGAMGIVYLGRQVSLDRPVAVKTLKQSIAKNEDFIRRFTREAQTAAQIIHNNIVQVYYVGRAGNTFYIAMEYVDGKSVRQIINEQKVMAEDEAMDLVLQASNGLQRAHRQNILHRDIKPDNLIMNKQGEVKLADFGLALDLGELKKGLSPAKVEGSPHYMSPEQAMRGEVSFASDIYSLGATLYHMVTSMPPFTGNSPAAIIAKHVTDYPRSPRELNPRLSKELCQAIQKMMAKRPEDRFASMDEVTDHLSRIRDDRTCPALAGGRHWFIEERSDSSRLRDLTAVLEINKVLAQERDLDTLLFRVVHEITGAMNAERSTLYVYDPDNREIWAKVAEGLEQGKIIRLPVGKGIAGVVAENLRTEIINDLYEDPRFNKEVDASTGFRTRNMICMPVLGSNVELLGVLQVLNKKTGDFDLYDQSLLSQLAIHVGLALERSSYYCALRPKCPTVRTARETAHWQKRGDREEPGHDSG
ncbi:MAG: protein kinase [Deltaproteobacteria bacterium]|nr:protein kinase [Deltaproteobacteria bacterium]